MRRDDEIGGRIERRVEEAASMRHDVDSGEKEAWSGGERRRIEWYERA